MTYISKEYKFDAAHQLIKCKSQECKNLHGHSYKITVAIQGELNQDDMVLDYKILDKIVNSCIYIYDHNNLNSIFVNPTAEVLAQAIFNDISESLERYKGTCKDLNAHTLKLFCIEVKETEKTVAAVFSSNIRRVNC